MKLPSPIPISHKLAIGLLLCLIGDIGGALTGKLPWPIAFAILVGIVAAWYLAEVINETANRRLEVTHHYEQSNIPYPGEEEPHDA